MKDHPLLTSYRLPLLSNAKVTKLSNNPIKYPNSFFCRYSANSFKLHRLPVPRPGVVLGLVGTNGIGKSTALKILSGKQKPNLGRYSDPPDWTEILAYFRGSELQNYFTKILEDDLKGRVRFIIQSSLFDFISIEC